MENKDSKIIFMGTPRFAETILTALIENKYNIISVYTQGDKKVGRKQELQESLVKILAKKNKIPVFTPEKIRPEIENIKKQNPDLIIVAAYGKIIPQEILDIPKFKCINIHPSLLPKYRGASPLQNTLLNGEKVTGTTIMLMTKEIDAGDILAQIEIEINSEEKLPEFSQKMSEKSAQLLIEILPGWINSQIEPRLQDASQATFCQMLNKEDGKVNWNEPVKNIFNRFRAFYPWPGIFSFWNSKRLKLNDIALSHEHFSEKKVGEVYIANEGVFVKAPDGAIQIKKIQLEGKQEVEIKNFINGYPDFIGSILN